MSGVEPEIEESESPVLPITPHDNELSILDLNQTPDAYKTPALTK